MLFNSSEFLIFFPIVILIYFTLPKKVRQYWLLIASYYFYMCWNAKYFILILFSTTVTFVSGLLIQKINNKEFEQKNKNIRKNIVVAASFILNLSVLFYFKYANFTFSILAQALSKVHINLSVPQFDVILPVGISFFTFQALSYTMDIYRGEICAEKNFFKYALFVSFFPQLVAGPIERSKNLIKQLSEPKSFEFERARDGILLMLWGYFLNFDNQSKLESNSNVWKGASLFIFIAAREEHIYAKSEDLYYDEMAKDYLMRMIQLCADKNVDLLLINTGYDCSDDAKYFADSINEIADQYEIPYIDITTLNVINFESDLATGGHNTHLNFSGAEKLTSFIGQVLSEQYQLSDYRSDEKYDAWWSDYQRFVKNKVGQLHNQSSLDLYLLMLADDAYNIIIETADTSIISENNNYAMFENLGIDMDTFSQNSNLLAIDMSSGEVSYLFNSYESGSKWKSVLGEISLQGDTDTYGMYLNGQEMYVVNSSESARIRITVISRDSEEVVDAHKF